MNIERIEPGPLFAQAVRANGTVWIAGQVAHAPVGDITEQTRQVLESIDRLLRLAGASRSNLVSVTVYLARIEDFPAMNAVWEEWVDTAAKPTRATVEARLAVPGYLVEMQAVAVV